MKLCYCMTANACNDTVVGSCRYACMEQAHWYPDPLKLNHHLCYKVWKRTGQLCSQCIDSHGPVVYSYLMQCVPCSPEVVKESVFFFLASFLLLTFFCLVVVTLRISGARPPMSTFILVSQIMTSPQYLQYFFAFPPTSRLGGSQEIHNTCWKLFAAFFGLWNLDMFRSFYPQMCLSQNMSTLQAQFLEYAIALFPLTMLIFIYFSVKLYDSGHQTVFFLCRPVHSCLAHFRRTVDIRTSLVDVFATFIILSVNKIGYTSFSILQPVHIYSPCGDSSLFVYIDPSIEYFGWGHLPYALPALFLTFVLILIPLLLLLVYPFRSFQSFLNRHQWQCSVLHIFADAFQGCYKNRVANQYQRLSLVFRAAFLNAICYHGSL